MYIIYNKSHKCDKGGGEVIDKNKLRGLIVSKGKTQEKVAKAIGIDRSTFYRKMKNDGDFSIGEVTAMVNYIPLTNEEAIEIFLNSKSHKRDKKDNIY